MQNDHRTQLGLRDESGDGSDAGLFGALKLIEEDPALVEVAENVDSERALRLLSDQGEAEPEERRRLQLTFKSQIFDRFNFGDGGVVSMGKNLNEARTGTIDGLLRNPDIDQRRVLAALTVETDEVYRTACERIRDEVAESVRSAMSLFSGGSRKPNPEDIERFVKEQVQDRMAGYFRERLAALEAFVDEHTGLLTGKFTRIYLARLIEQEIPTAVMALDMKKLGPLNTALGMNLTDEVLKQFFVSLERSSRVTDFMSLDPDNVQRRQAGGDEAFMIFPGVQDLGDLSIVMNKMRDKMAEPVTLEVSAEQWAAIMATYSELMKKQGEGVVLTDKEAGALDLIDEFKGQVSQQKDVTGSQNTDTLKLNIKLEMRLGGMLLDSTSGSSFEEASRQVDDLLPKVEDLVTQAKKLEANGQQQPSLVLDKDGRRHVMHAGTRSFELLKEAA